MPLALKLFGPPRVERDGQPLATDRRKALALLAYLAVTGSAKARAHSREKLAALLWPEYESGKAFAYLRRTLWELNQMLGAGWLTADRETVELTGSLQVDALDFARRVAEARAAGADRCGVALPLLTEAAALYTDHFLAGFNLKDALDFDEWAGFQAEGYRRDLAWVLEALARCHTEQDAEAALPYARRWLSLDTLNETAHRALMLAYAKAGQLSAALRQYQDCERVLREELGAEPEEATKALLQQIKAGETGSGGAGEKGSVSPAPRPSLPQQATPFLGRQQQLTEIAELLARPECRLLTIVGPGGVGKTRLALRAAEAQLPNFAQGVFFVPLAPVAAPEFIAPAIAEGVGFQFFGQANPTTQLQQLSNYLREKQLLLVLDNFEHLMPAAEHVSELLQAAPRLRVIVTSRERLNLQEEFTLTLAGMRVPALAEIESAASAQLFVQTAQRVRVGFTLAEADHAPLVQLIQMLDGLPLGIELAATWVKTLPVNAIAAEIERGLDILETPLKNVTERHRSLRAVFEYSWRLLSERERAAFARLAVFQGRFGREAAQTVAEAPLPVLAGLVDKSLVYQLNGHYDLHMAVRQFAAEKLGAAYRAARERHCAYYAEFARSRLKALRGHGQKHALDEFAEEIDNLRAGFRWAVEHGAAEAVGGYLESLMWFYDSRSRFQEAEELLNAARETWKAADLIGAQLLTWQAWFNYRLGKVPLAQARYREALARLKALGKRAQETLAFANLQAVIARTFTELEEALPLLRLSADYFRATGNRWGSAFLQPFLSLRAPFPEQERAYLESIAEFRDLGDRRMAAVYLMELGELVHHQGLFARAMHYYAEAMPLTRELGDRFALAQALDYSGWVARQMGDHALARAQHEESLALSREIGDALGLAGSLDNLGLLALEMGDLPEAERLLNDGLARRRASGEKWSTLVSLSHVGELALAQGDVPRAEAFALEGLAVEPRYNMLLNVLGSVRLRQGRLAEAFAAFREGLRWSRVGDTRWLMVDTFARLAEFYEQSGEAPRAVELAAFVLNQPACDAATRRRAERLLQSLALPAADRANAEARGRALTWEQAIEWVELAEERGGR